MLRKASPDYTAALFRRERGMWHRWDEEPRRPDKTAKQIDPLPVYVNDGRWVISCPCGGAQIAVTGQTEFFCVDCLNDYCAGLWRPVVWPKDEAAIDELLSERPKVNNRHWLPGETVKQLRDENKKLLH